MKYIYKFLIAIFSYGVALWVATTYVQGFSLAPTLEAYAKCALILTLLHVFIRPILKIILSPLILITFGFGVFIVNALLLYGVDMVSSDLAIAGLYPLVYATLIISVVSAVLSYTARKTSSETD